MLLVKLFICQFSKLSIRLLIHSKSMAFQTTNARELTNRKILEELQLKKQMLLKQGAIPLTNTPLSIPAVSGNAPNPGPEHLSSIQRGAILQAQASVGYFIPQDSIYNVILPVLPRLENK